VTAIRSITKGIPPCRGTPNGVTEPHVHHHPSEVPEGQRLAAALTHFVGMFFLFVPALVVWLRVRRDPSESWLTHQAKEALNFQYTVTALFVICAMLGWTGTSIGLRIAPFVLAFDWLFAIIAIAKALRGERYVYPLKIGFLR
jgi:uncharacterized Tic20 family protein